MKKKAVNYWKCVLPILFILLVIPFLIGGYVTIGMRSGIISELEAMEVGANTQADCILVLGAGIRPDGTPSFMLRHRLDKGIELYEAGVAPKLLLSGDNGQERYDEVNAMKGYVLAQGVPAEDIFLDHAGFSTYDSIYRAKAVFAVEEAVVVTQNYHLYRALLLPRGWVCRLWVSAPRAAIMQDSGEGTSENFWQKTKILSCAS